MKSKLVQAVFEGGKTAYENVELILQTSEGEDANLIREAMSVAAVEIRVPAGASEDERNRADLQRQYQLAVIYKFLQHFLLRPSVSEDFAKCGGVADIFQRAALSGLLYSCQDILNFSKQEKSGLWQEELTRPDGIAMAFPQLLEAQTFFSTKPIDVFFDAARGNESLSYALCNGFPRAIRNAPHKMQTLVNVLDRTASNPFTRCAIVETGSLRDIYFHCREHSSLLSSRVGFIMSQVPEWQAAVS